MFVTKKSISKSLLKSHVVSPIPSKGSSTPYSCAISVNPFPSWLIKSWLNWSKSLATYISGYMSSFAYIGKAEKLLAFSIVSLKSISWKVSLPKFLYNLFGDIWL